MSHADDEVVVFVGTLEHMVKKGVFFILEISS